MTQLLSPLLPKQFRKSTPIIPVVRLRGMIAASGSPVQPALSLAVVAPALARAFSIKRAPAVAISVNSPGGSPVQSRLIYKRIRDLADEKNKPVFTFTEDVAASGGYMLAAAGDEIIADPSSIIGSIGVISAGFGFVDAIKKLGVERRVYTAGQNKSTLDPFQPEKEEDIERLKAIQLDVHQVFIDLVKARRGDKLADDPDLFTGRFWAGEKARELGLVDDIGDMRSFMRARFGENTMLKLVTMPRGLFGRRPPVGVGWNGGLDPAALSAQFSSGLLSALEERALWNRYGL
ncbi:MULTISPECIES: S49 family peptidase [unclassified Roseitalea]|uniref:S49 family peptidase n=1 Tax=unclassified Roseitalea TaxID=2639107 RepID=UPI00273ED1E0|nr:MULTISPECIES: S49 family peptidase [unclassified Roseitalea]